MKRIAINGMGRTGRLMLRRFLTGSAPRGLTLVAVNDIAAPDDVAYLTRYDSVHGRLPQAVEVVDGHLTFAEERVRVLTEREPKNLPWAALQVDVVIESTGQFTRRDAAAAHLDAGAARVLIGAPSPDADATLVLGVNEDVFDPNAHTVVSNASCTTNSLAPVLKVLDDTFGITEALATTVHAYTATQGLVDKAAGKKHRGRAAALSMIPTSTGADSATAVVLPALQGKLGAIAVRVPVADGSITDISARLDKPADAERVNDALRHAAAGVLDGILGYTEEELVSADILGRQESGIVHGLSTKCVGNLVKVLVWYDNEAGYAARCLDVADRLL